MTLISHTRKLLRSKLKEEMIKQLQEKHKRPNNVENLQVPKVDEVIWHQLRKETKSYDFAMQKKQAYVRQTLVPVMKLMQMIKEKESTESMHKIVSDIFIMLTRAVVQSNEGRMEKILCATTPSAELLFGDKLQEKVKQLREVPKTTMTNQPQLRKPFLSKRGGATAHRYSPAQITTFRETAPSPKTTDQQTAINVFTRRDT